MRERPRAVCARPSPAALRAATLSRKGRGKIHFAAFFI